jgi:hypothetical protein
MQKVLAVFRGGHVELTTPVNWPKGTAVEVISSTDGLASTIGSRRRRLDGHPRVLVGQAGQCLGASNKHRYGR